MMGVIHSHALTFSMLLYGYDVSVLPHPTFYTEERWRIKPSKIVINDKNDFPISENSSCSTTEILKTHESL